MAINTAPLVGKWLIAPAIARVTIIVNPETVPMRETFYLREFETAAAPFNIEPITRFVHNAGDIENAMTRKACSKIPWSRLRGAAFSRRTSLTRYDYLRAFSYVPRVTKISNVGEPIPCPLQ